MTEKIIKVAAGQYTPDCEIQAQKAQMKKHFGESCNRTYRFPMPSRGLLNRILCSRGLSS